MKSLSFAQIKSIVNGDANPAVDINVDSVCVNPVKVGKNALFVALNDNAADISLAIENGAVAVLSEKPVPNVQSGIVVGNVKSALLALALHNRKQVDAFVVCITGGVGKSSTAEMVQTILSVKGKAVATKCTSDSEVDISLALLRLNRDVRYAAIKIPVLSTSLAAGCRPSVFVATNVSTYGDSRENLNRVLSIASGITYDMPLVLNADDALLAGAEIAHPIIYYGINNHSADVVAYDIVHEENKTSFDVNYYGKTIKMTIPSVGQHNVLNALAAFCVGIVADISPDQIANAMKWHKNEVTRKKVSVVKGIKIINDCKNATPDSMAAALDVITNLDVKGKRICVFGDMSCKCEMGDEAHIELGKAIGRSSVSMLLCFGEKGRLIKKGAIIVGMKSAIHFETAQSLSDYLKANAAFGDIVMFKACADAGLDTALDLFMKSIKSHGEKPA